MPAVHSCQAQLIILLIEHSMNLFKSVPHARFYNISWICFEKHPTQNQFMNPGNTLSPCTPNNHHSYRWIMGDRTQTAPVVSPGSSSWTSPDHIYSRATPGESDKLPTNPTRWTLDLPIGPLVVPSNCDQLCYVQSYVEHASSASFCVVLYSMSHRNMCKTYDIPNCHHHHHHHCRRRRITSRAAFVHHICFFSVTNYIIFPNSI